MRVALDAEGLGDLHAAGLRNAADVVARQVDQHHVLGALLRVGQQLGLQRLVLLGCGPARTRAGDGPHGDDLAGLLTRAGRVRRARKGGGQLLTHQDLRRRAHDLEVPHVVVVHVGAGVERAQRPVQRQRALGVALLQALAQHDLHAVARGNVGLATLHCGLERSLGELALHGIAGAAPDLGRRDGKAQLVDQLGQALLAVEPGVGRARIGPDDEVQAPGQVVDDGQLLGLQQLDVGRADAAGLAHAVQLLLDEAHGLVAEVAGQAATEPRQPRAQGRLEAGLDLGDEVQRVALVRLHHPTVGDDLAALPRGTQQRAGRQPDEGIAPEALAAHHRLQQKAVAAASSELQVQRQRGFEVGKGLGDEGNAVVAFGGKALEFEFGDHGFSPGRHHNGLHKRSVRCVGKSGHCAALAGQEQPMREDTVRRPRSARSASPGPGSPALRARDGNWRGCGRGHGDQYSRGHVPRFSSVRQSARVRWRTARSGKATPWTGNHLACGPEQAQTQSARPPGSCWPPGDCVATSLDPRRTG